jgi:hypothetical protein
VYTTQARLWGKPYIHSQPALPWHVNRDYDFLKTCPVPPKERPISWVTSNLQVLKGHRQRLLFLDRLREKLDFDLYGRGFASLEDKWDGVAPYSYSLAIENFSNEYYWSEKLADCFLCWTMPIYYGCTCIHTYFPPEAMICINIHDPDSAVEQIKQALAVNLCKRNREAIAYARELVLERYQFFPFVTRELQELGTSPTRYMPITLTPQLRPPLTVSTLLYRVAWLGAFRPIKDKLNRVRMRLAKFLFSRR